MKEKIALAIMALPFLIVGILCFIFIHQSAYDFIRGNPPSCEEDDGALSVLFLLFAYPFIIGMIIFSL